VNDSEITQYAELMDNLRNASLPDQALPYPPLECQNSITSDLSCGDRFFNVNIFLNSPSGRLSDVKVVGFPIDKKTPGHHPHQQYPG